MKIRIGKRKRIRLKLGTKTLKRLIKNPISLLGLVLVSFFTLMAITAPWLAPPPRPREPYRIPRYGFSAVPKPPTDGNPLRAIWKIATRQATLRQVHPFGTTEGQYDVYYGIVWGTRTAFRIGLIVTGSVVLIGIVIGTIAAYYGGIVDEIIMRITDIFLVFPFLVAAIVLTTILGKGLDKVMIALIVFGWPTYARLIRGDILSVKEKDFVEATRAAGANDLRIIFRHILPNTIYPVFVVATLQIGSLVLTAAALSFLGLGAGVGYADWGQMISFARNWIIGTGVTAGGSPFTYWYVLIYPGMAILLFVLSWSLLGDAFRDILDPRMRGAR
ncbi:MAG: ABC transporter permease [Candidatus Bipolaricaulia bacterium]